MKMRKIDAFELNSMAISFSEENKFLMPNETNTTGIPYIEEYIQQNELLKSCDKILEKLGINSEDTPEVYSAISEMIVALLDAEAASTSENGEINDEKLATLEEIALGNMLSQIDNHEQQILSLRVIKDIFSSLSLIVNEAIKNPEAAINNAFQEEAKLYDENLIAESTNTIFEAEEIRIENDIEEITSTLDIHINYSKKTALIQKILAFEKEAYEDIGFLLKIDRKMIKEILISEN